MVSSELWVEEMAWQLPLFIIDPFTNINAFTIERMNIVNFKILVYRLIIFSALLLSLGRADFTFCSIYLTMP